MKKNVNNKIATNDYKAKLLKRMIILCWIVLGVCCLVKLFGGNFFNIICEDKRFIKICNYIQNSFWYYVISFIFYCLNTILIWLSMARCIMVYKKHLFVLILVILLFYIIQVILQLYINSFIISFILTIVRYIILPILILKLKLKNILIICGLDIITQFTTLIIKDLSIVKLIDDNVLISLIFMIDYYIMTILIYLYSYKSNKNKENKYMGLFGGWWLHKPLAELEALLPTLKDKKEIDACKKRIEKLKTKDEKKKSN